MEFHNRMIYFRRKIVKHTLLFERIPIYPGTTNCVNQKYEIRSEGKKKQGVSTEDKENYSSYLNHSVHTQRTYYADANLGNFKLEYLYKTIKNFFYDDDENINFKLLLTSETTTINNNKS